MVGRIRGIQVDTQASAMTLSEGAECMAKRRG